MRPRPTAASRAHASSLAGCADDLLLPLELAFAECVNCPPPTAKSSTCCWLGLGSDHEGAR
uniref:Uncharacterized protein n=1 Tax=Arundo donax TaxID=35708 RepID=A0A0A9B7V7_ARUDO